MKIVCIDSLNERFFVKADTTLLRNGDPFFTPNFGSQIERVDGVAVRITRIVKCIEPRFAHRAWDEWFSCTEHRVVDVDEQSGRNFDRSFAVDNEMQPKNTLSSCAQSTFDQSISFVSEYLSLRIGDYVFIPNSLL